MSQDTCTAETPDGTCGNPQTADTPEDGREDRCWIPSHNDPEAENPHGRDFAIDESDHEAILKAARNGMSKAGCARAAGVTRDELRRYVNAHANFRAEFTQARAEGERELVRGALFSDENAEREMDGQHARFLLSTSFDYVKTERQEHAVDTDAELDDGFEFIYGDE